jgi:hypothetical protein
VHDCSLNVGVIKQDIWRLATEFLVHTFYGIGSILRHKNAGPR